MHRARHRLRNNTLHTRCIFVSRTVIVPPPSLARQSNRHRFWTRACSLHQLKRPIRCPRLAPPRSPSLPPVRTALPPAGNLHIASRCRPAAFTILRIIYFSTAANLNKPSRHFLVSQPHDAPTPNTHTHTHTDTYTWLDPTV
ncbi:unnamed protein product [Chondrus crispus]|uniref:Uncharacterized protein n=1 Tax=Chondrus crispus TaxID=2769 RepID=R7QN53_CHOCR|nr:unnamed protein product [Chondrus crispus]CDF39213.1 unnamed protein product [Chondrus crispus]|eukprot:XP_005719124.1 unnamed protein product [Chondrus crispus]